MLPRTLVAFLLAASVFPKPVGAVLDIEDQGPQLDAGRFALRITNAGIIGNAFFDVGRSFDPSFEFPIHSGQECLNQAALWVAALEPDGVKRVSGGPLLEWRPTLSSEDRVRGVRRGDPGTRRLVDDDGDGRTDEETLNGKDDDGDGYVDEDLGLIGDQMLSADYTDDQREAIDYVYPTYEKHRPLGLSVHQEAYAWSAPGYDGIAGLTFRITNHGSARLKQIYAGLLVDLDSRLRSDRLGHLDDRIIGSTTVQSIGEGTSVITVESTPRSQPCIARIERPLAILVDGAVRSTLPAVAVLPLEHTTDPLARTPARAYARAPAEVGFRFSTFEPGGEPGRGGLPIVDADRYDAMAGVWPTSPANREADYATLVSCGPFPFLDPGQSIEFTVALVAAENREALEVAAANALFLHHGVALNLRPDTTESQRDQWLSGATGIFGHEVCLEPPPGVSFIMDANCAAKFPESPAPTEVLYRPGRCVWTDLDCDPCTGLRGAETIVRWLDTSETPPAPAYRTLPGDHRVRIEWDNTPEVLIAGGQVGPPPSVFLGYRLYRLADWRGRAAAVPPRENWALIGAFGPDSALGETPMNSIVDTTLDYDEILHEQRRYPVGRYFFLDSEVMNGFDYLYAVTTVYERREALPGGGILAKRLETPLAASFDHVVSPQASAHSDLSRVWVVPNPYRGSAPWERPAVPGDVFTRQIAFMGLPRAPCTIRIWTLAGDLVAEVAHDGADGQASWNLISRNGQDVESGVYLFTVASGAGRATGHFVVIR